MKIGNALVAGVLLSPLHRLLSRSLLLLTYVGTRTGTEYTLPLQYVEDHGTLYIWAGDAAAKTWWRNFAAPMVAEVRLRGHDAPVKGRLVDDPGRRREILASYLDRFPYTGPVGRPELARRRRRWTDRQLADTAASMVVVALEPT
jgi:deazaflavin-dependent oxidoreductase (nitroreductase family)